MQRFPKSILLFLLTGVVFLVQHFPFVGVFLMILGAPLWSVITINLGFVLMAKEAWEGKLPRALVVLPILYFSIYAGITIASHWQLFWLRREIAANNESVHVAFDPQQNDLVIETKIVDSGLALSKVPENLVEAYDIPVVYGLNGDRRGPALLSYKVSSRKECDAARRGDPRVATFAFQENGKFDFGLCLMRHAEEPTKSAVSVSAEEGTTTQNWLLPTTVETITVTDANNQSFTLKGGTAAPFDWIPMPVMGCMLDSGAAAWRCFAELDRTAFTPLAGESSRDVDHNANTAAIAAALGLTAQPASKRISAPASEAVAQSGQVDQATERDNELKRFHDLVTNLELPDWQFPYLLQHPEATAADAPAMVQALQRAEQVTTETHNGRQYSILKYSNTNIRFVLAKMIARLPENAYAPLVPQLVEIVRTDTSNAESLLDNWSLEARAPAFMTRLGDAAPAEMVELYLATLRKEHSPFDVLANNAQTTAALGLCRAGAEYAPRAKDALVRLLASTGQCKTIDQHDLHSAAYVALLRMGLKDAVANDPASNRSDRYAVMNDPTGKRRDQIFHWYQDKLATVTPASPKEVCLTMR